MSIRKKIKKRLPIFGRRFRTEDNNASADIAKDTETTTQTPYTRPKITQPVSRRGELPVAEFISSFVKEHDIVIFMKGSPASPSCGFSATASSILGSYQVPFEYFDVFSDQDVRQGVKEFSSWPTLPQIYIGGEFMGGCDIITQMHNSGELKEEIDRLVNKDG